MKYLADENLLRDQQGGFRNTYDVLNDLAKNYDLVRGGVGWSYEIKVDKEGTKPVEKRGLYDLYIDNHMDIPDTISKDSPCYKQFMKELERK